ncbi:aminoacyl-tRNA hydrolase [Ureaplasma zalophigenitalium]|uniref:Peptidyl-tRNA hydrolase n=1 Tax=Ureaplasma zalophigenitalium TaxID=907723 RepID=A0ABT3BNH9_9BACT|nr:aminoacyl-tRNA hydrolase [Ureaplasma zalophigenitalium]MCV3753795.1 aminoacyl-tRNA hydrolase [Ureaplasma zalophigenitalium]
MEKILIVGLGNPGSKYNHTRHNIGFLSIDNILHFLNLQMTDHKFNGDYTKTLINNRVVYFAKPSTYMNLSGDFVSKFINFFDIPKNNVLIIYDDVDTKIGNFKMRLKGSSGGQNGMKNILLHFPNNELKRVRIGIGKEEHKDLANYVLSRFKPEELISIQPVLNKVTNAIMQWLKGDSFEKVMSTNN